MGKTELQLQKLEQLATGSRLLRLLHDPGRYLYAIMLLKLAYPISRKGSLKKASLFFGGDMQVLLPAATDIYLTGGKTHDSEIRLAKYLVTNLHPGDTFVDIGAHFGYFSLLAAVSVGENGRVLGVEPSKSSYGILKANVAGKSNVEVFHNAVSDKSELVNFYEFPVLYSEYNALDIEKFEDEVWIKKYNPEITSVEAVTIDDFLAIQQAKPAMIKIDVEGAEIKAINGASVTWQKQSPVLIMEYLDEGEDSSYVVASEIMKTNGYTANMILHDGRLEQTDDILAYMRQREIKSENVVFKKHNK